jgi:hypothetical protein
MKSNFARDLPQGVRIVHSPDEALGLTGVQSIDHGLASQAKKARIDCHLRAGSKTLSPNRWTGQIQHAVWRFEPVWLNVAGLSSMN